MKSYLDSPQYQALMAQALHGGQAQGPGGGLANAGQQIMSALLMKRMETQGKQREADYANALMEAQKPQPVDSVAITPRMQRGDSVANRTMQGAYDQPTEQSLMAKLLATGNQDVTNDFLPMALKSQMDASAAANQPITPYQRENWAQQAARSKDDNTRMMAQLLLGQQGANERSQAGIDAADRRAKEANASRIQAANIAAAGAANVANIRAGVQQGKPMPQGVQKAEDDDLDAIATATNIERDLAPFGDAVASGKLALGPYNNRVSGVQNWLGMSSEGSREYGSFMNTLERLRNDSLRLNKGMQTEGDAQRAWNELVSNTNDSALVSRRLKEIQGINARAAQLRAQNVDIRRQRNNAERFDWTGFKIPSSPYETQQSAPPPQMPPPISQPQQQMQPQGNAPMAQAQWMDLGNGVRVRQLP